MAHHVMLLVLNSALIRPGTGPQLFSGLACTRIGILRFVHRREPGFDIECLGDIGNTRDEQRVGKAVEEDSCS